ncbi:unnamed protein product [Parajaminaea phylloscopi]
MTLLPSFVFAVIVALLGTVHMARSADISSCKGDVACINVLGDSVSLAIDEGDVLDITGGLHRYNLASNTDVHVQATCKHASGGASITFLAVNDPHLGNVEALRGPFQYSADGHTWLTTNSGQVPNFLLAYVRCT